MGAEEGGQAAVVPPTGPLPPTCRVADARVDGVARVGVQMRRGGHVEVPDHRDGTVAVLNRSTAGEYIGEFMTTPARGQVGRSVTAAGPWF